MRIALSGSAGTGKTTLALALARGLDLPYVEEGMRRRLQAGFDLHALDLDAWRRLLRELWDEQRAREASAPAGFVADRSSLDYAAFWLHYGLFEDAAATARWVDEMASAAQGYDAVVLLPWGALPLEDDGVRSTNPWVQLRFQALVESFLVRSIRPERLIRVTGGGAAQERLELVLERLGVRPSP